MIKKIYAIGLILILIISFCLGAKTCTAKGSNTKVKSSGDIQWSGLVAPSDLIATVVSSSQVNLSWTDNSNNEDGFEIARSLDNNQNFVVIGTSGPNINLYTDSSAVPFIAHYYRIRSFNTIGDRSTWTNQAIVPVQPVFTRIECGDEHILLLDNNSYLWSSGKNGEEGRLGLGDTINRTTPTQLTEDWLYEPFNNITFASAGNNHSFARKTNPANPSGGGTLWAWGYNNIYGQLGLGLTGYYDPPYPLGTDSDWTEASAGYWYSLGHKTNRTIYCWGWNYYGQLGLGTNGLSADQRTPYQMGIDSDWIKITAGTSHSFAIKSNGTLFAWGNNNCGQLGLGNTTLKNSPTQIGTESDWANALASGESFLDFNGHSLALKTNGTIYSCGYNNNGQLGLGDHTYWYWDFTDPDNPVQIFVNHDRNTLTQIGTDSDWTEIALGISTAIARKTNGTIYSWGVNRGYAPAKIESDTDWVEISAGNAFTLARKTNGIVYSWGINNIGQLGLGDTTDRDIPCPLGSPTPPEKPLNLNALSSRIDITWLENSSNEEGFYIERKEISGEYIIIATVNANTESYSDTTVSYGTQYYYRVRAFNSFGGSSYTDPQTATPTLIAPSHLTVPITASNFIALSWQDDSIDENGFRIERKDGATGTFAEIGTVGQNITVYTSTGLSVGTMYTYRVRAYNAYESTYSNETSATPTMFAPTSLACTIGSSTRLNLTWEDKSVDEDGFRIDRKTGAGGTYGELATVEPNITSYSNSGLTQGQAYYYKIRSFNSYAGNSGYSNETSGTPVILAPSLLTARIIPPTQVQITWQDNSSEEAGFKVERKITRNGIYEQIAVVTANIISYSDTTVTPEGYYFYKVRTYDIDGNNSTYSNETEIAVGVESGYLSVAVGENHTVALRSSGTIWAWGRGNSGQLGQGSTMTSILPYQVGTATDWTNVYTKFNHTIGRKSNWTIYSWGYNSSGQLGLGNSGNTPRYTPTQIGTDSDWYNISTGEEHTVALKTNGTLYSWGRNYFGQLGIGSSGLTQRTTPTQIIIGTDSDWSVATAGSSHTVAIKTDGTLWAWGLNSSGQLGLGDTYDRSRPNQIGRTPSPYIVITATLDSLTQITLTWSDTNDEQSFQLFSDINGGGYVFRGTFSPNVISFTDTTIVYNVSFTNTYSYRLKAANNTGESFSMTVSLGVGPANIGRSVTVGPFPEPRFDSDWSKIAAGYNHSIALKTNNTMWSWGYEELGIGNTILRTTPTQIGTNSDWAEVSAGYKSTIGKKTNGTIYSWGYNSGQLGLGDTANRYTPTQIGTDSDWFIIAVNENSNGHSSAIKTNGTIYMWGADTYYQLGLGDNINRLNPTGLGSPSSPSNNLSIVLVSPQQINILWTDRAFNEDGFIIERKVSATGTYFQIGTVGANITSYADTTGLPEIYYYYRVMAYNSFGNSGYTNEYGAPFGIDTGYALIATGKEYTLSIRTNGTIWAWGNNTSGQLGFGYTQTSQYFPQLSGTDSDWSKISAGENHSLAVKSNGTLYSWGDNASGKLGYTGLARYTPTQVGIDSNWIEISAGNDFSLGRKNNNTIHSWGYNYNGQLGLGIAASARTTPVQIGTDSDWSGISGGFSSYATAIKTNGTIYSWGQNNNGQLGLGDQGIDRNTPTQIGTNSIWDDWTAVKAGYTFTLGRKANGTLHSWGDNSYGQLGLGDSGGGAQRLTPTQIGTDSDWTEASGGAYHAIAHKSSGTIYSWGYNNYYQLGLLDNTTRCTPTQIGTNSSWNQISAGENYGFARKTNSTIWAWGYNTSGQLGFGDWTTRTTPTQVGK